MYHPLSFKPYYGQIGDLSSQTVGTTGFAELYKQNRKALVSLALRFLFIICFFPGGLELLPPHRRGGEKLNV